MRFLCSFFSRKEADELKLEVAKWRVAEAAAREKLLSITNTQSRTTAALSPPPVNQLDFFAEINSNYLFRLVSTDKSCSTID